MTVPVQTPINSYVYAGSPSFIYSFQLLQAADLLVTVDGAVKTLGVDYTVAGVGAQAGGSITYVGTITVGQLVSLSRQTALRRATDYQTLGDFLAGTINNDFDRLWMALQERATNDARSVRVPAGETLVTLPAAASRAGFLLGFDGSGGLALIASVAQSATALALSLAGTAGSSLVGFIQAGVGMLARTVQDKLRERVDLADVAGADPTGTTDSSAALLAALNTGKAVYLGDKSRTWKFTSTVNYTGPVYIFGKGATVKSDVLTFHFTDATGSRVHGFNIYPITTPWTLNRSGHTGGNAASWTLTSASIVQSLEGYKPTSLDTDVWAAFVGTANEITNRSITPGILFDVSSAAGGSDVRVERIGGRQVNIIIQGYVDSGVRFCNYGAGGLTYGGAVFMNNVGRAYNSALLGFTLPQGTGNFFDDNRIKYASLSGACWFGNTEGSIQRNTSQFNGESGIKLYAYDGAVGPSETRACQNTAMRIVGNNVTDNYYDGLDAQLIYGVAQEFAYGASIIKGNSLQRNRHTGLTVNAWDTVVEGNYANMNGTHGLSVIGSNNTVNANHCRNNTTTGSVLVAQPFDVFIQGDDCVSTFNNVSNPTAVATWNYLHSGYGGSAPVSSHEGLDFGNYCDQGASRITVSSTIPTSKQGVQGVPFVQTSGYLQTSPVISNVAATYTVSATDSAISFFTSATCTVTLPSAATYPGRQLKLRNTAAFAIVSASANVGQPTGGAPSTAILAATAGKWCELQSDGSNWIIVGYN